MAEVQLIATIRPASGKEDEVREILRQTAQLVTQVEKGCFTFILAETTTPKNEVEFKVIERWASHDHLTQHQNRDWLCQMYSDFEDKQLLAGGEEIQYLEVLGGFANR